MPFLPAIQKPPGVFSHRRAFFFRVSFSECSSNQRVFDLAEALFVVKSPYTVFWSLFQWQVPGELLS
jgi:hypothetical protein